MKDHDDRTAAGIAAGLIVRCYGHIDRLHATDPHAAADLAFVLGLAVGSLQGSRRPKTAHAVRRPVGKPGVATRAQTSSSSPVRSTRNHSDVSDRRVSQT